MNDWLRASELTFGLRSLWRASPKSTSSKSFCFEIGHCIPQPWFLN